MRVHIYGMIAAALLLACGSEQDAPVAPVEDPSGGLLTTGSLLSWVVYTDEEIQSLTVTSKRDLRWWVSDRSFQTRAEKQARVTEQEWNEVSKALDLFLVEHYKQPCPDPQGWELLDYFEGDAGSQFAIGACEAQTVSAIREVMKSLKSKYVDM
ncbi:MAG: hypothetical protein R3284_04570 [Rubricoccaceae bacterium]|nr:hypothetical protein [Rubricoccaceae bacterium]